ncbi:MAG: carbamoyl-phosphate synthase large subunit [Saprospiraceae bacterium]|nr:carbamoyl-phosphate synthase large subunit [Saprospiraceae bacterium]HMW39261.1 carbamoyl-phosphate synthase large subunit [Saprospiraceae bacterium]HMX87971.1 carbamoyl-phosphate synthase large subunit [Saprospiraceae bacterium]HMZ39979.1 carbamoyl-phosphate synthase large subunit [Saprospiraceae bacterium]HNA63754.1 carbamoyl-phosphate synthase large subunit [Saprospiraceae bacterium]
MPKDHSIRSVLIIGSGPIIIGQACEFDYSGTQAARALRDEGIEVSLINSNPATIMTDPVTADHIYLWPLTVESIIKILEERKIDAVLPTMGGQTALNLAIEADRQQVWKQYGVKMIGVDIAAIELTEDREKFRAHMVHLGVGVAPSRIANSFLEGKEASQEIGFPLVIRPSFTLGGTGGSFVHKADQFDEALRRGLDASPTHEVLVEKAVLGWKEFELELLRDKNDNVVIICTVENLDPMGIHTGDSITVAPAMTLSDTGFQKMRDSAIMMMRSIGNFAGGCNVQFAMDPVSEDIIAVEINPRVSRSSALASKATGYPIAKIAAKLALGFTLDELANPVTGTTSALFEPSLDYVIVKMPRWNFEKFWGADTRLGLQMKSVGEVMAIGRSFNEALQKACQSLENDRQGLGADKKEWFNTQDILERLEKVSDDRIFRLKDALRLGVPEKSVQKLTGIDPWFIREIKHLVHLDEQIARYNVPEDLTPEFMTELKKNGYSDAQIAWLMRIDEELVTRHRRKLGLRRVYKRVDTCAAEFEARTNYYYSTFDDHNESEVHLGKKRIMVLGSGPNRIGQGIEFDYCCVHGVMAIRELGMEAIMINCNPETVSTDSDLADKLYFEPIFWEHLEDIIDHEKPDGIIVQLGGQTALKLSEKIHRKGIQIVGTSYESMDVAEDRGRFSDLLKEMDIPYPRYGVASDADEALTVAKKIGYPVLVRPSYVLGGQRMRIVINDEELERQVLNIFKHMPDNRVLIDEFLERAKEAEIDAICDGEEVHIMGIMEHIEPAGIHSGDSSAVLPTYSLSEKAIETMIEYARRIALRLNIRGLINIQFAIKGEKVYVIEANPRASRTTPFIAKAYQVPYLNIATKVMLGTHRLKDFEMEHKLNGYAIKVPVFSFNKFPGVDISLGPEMKSTGEAIYYIRDLYDPYFRELDSRRNMYLSR